MFIVTRPISRTYNHVQDEQWELRCHRCGKGFKSLEDAYLCYTPPPAGSKSEAYCCHKRCATGEAQLRLMRADHRLQRLLTPLVTPAIPEAALKDLPRRIARPWGQP